MGDVSSEEQPDAGASAEPGEASAVPPRPADGDAPNDPFVPDGTDGPPPSHELLVADAPPFPAEPAEVPPAGMDAPPYPAPPTAGNGSPPPDPTDPSGVAAVAEQDTASSPGEADVPPYPAEPDAQGEAVAPPFPAAPDGAADQDVPPLPVDSHVTAEPDLPPFPAAPAVSGPDVWAIPAETGEPAGASEGDVSPSPAEPDGASESDVWAVPAGPDEWDGAADPADAAEPDADPSLAGDPGPAPEERGTFDDLLAPPASPPLGEAGPPPPDEPAAFAAPPPDGDVAGELPPAPPPPGATRAHPDGPRRGPVDLRDRHTLLLAGLAALGLVVAAILLFAVVRILSGGEDTDAINDDPVPGELGQLVPVVAASPSALARDDGAVRVAELLEAGETVVAADTPAHALCAAVPLSSSLTVTGRWERDGHEIATTEARQVAAPGFGDCLDDGGAELPTGTYQFVVGDDAGHFSSPATIVLGAAPITQTFVNDGDEPLCVVRLAPRAAGLFETYDFSATPITPNASVMLPVAAVRHVVSAVPCGSSDATDEVAFQPDSTRSQSLVER